MAENSTGARRAVRRVLGAAVAVSLVAAVAALGSAAVAQPSTEQKLDAAKAEFAQLKKDIASQQAELARLQAQAAVLAERYEQAYGRYEQITEDLRNTTLELRQAQEDHRALQEQLEARAREAYMTGPGSELEFLLGAATLADLSARLEYVNALTAEDADLATSVQNLRNELAGKKEDQTELQAKAAKALAEAEADRDALYAKLGEQQAILDDLAAKKARAEELVQDLAKQYRKELEALTASRVFPNSVLQVCPVGQPRALYDGFGAPRYGGGYHPHAGNDIIAPQGTPIFATFDGFAQAGYNTLGGNSVRVTGAAGYTYNAHLVQPGFTGSVRTGDVIGYVGATGDTSTPHLHFEWHPNAIPANWPASSYGYSVIGGAVNPYPLLAPIC